METETVYFRAKFPKKINQIKYYIAVPRLRYAVGEHRRDFYVPLVG